VRTVEISVRGLPQPQGSARAFVAGGRAIVATEGNRPSSPLGAWRTAIAAEARAAMGGQPAMDGPVSVSVDFSMRRPRSHYRADGGLKPTAPAWCSSKPDADKLLRSLLDAITGVVIGDDARVAVLHARKPYETPDRPTGCRVVVRTLEATR
jgi:Holliday junction resolvase RusA-like endonuclease